MPKLYLAGPDVFRPDAVEYGKLLISICTQYKCIGLYPLFEASQVEPSTEGAAIMIAKANEESIRECDALVANISPFRGPNVDDGTAYEIGFARALGKPTFLCSSTMNMLKDRVRAVLHKGPAGLRDINGDLIEDFGLPANLMITPSPYTPVEASAEAAIRAAAIHLGVWKEPAK